MSYASVNLPMPPSANRMWRNGNTRHGKSAEYEGWKRAASWDVNVQRKGLKFTEPVALIVIVKRQSKRADLDNLMKPLIDSLQAGCLLQDDNLVESITVRWAKDFDNLAKDVCVEVRST